jgi:glutaredoxin-like protein
VRLLLEPHATFIATGRISDEDLARLKGAFDRMLTLPEGSDERRALVFTTDNDQHACELCDDTRQLLEEIACVSDGKITVTVYDLARDAAQARAHDVSMAPAVVIADADGGDHGVRFFGIPSGYELASLLSAVLMMSRGDDGLDPGTRGALAHLDAPARLQVFVTPTCPYCPSAVTLAHRMAVASPNVTAEMIDASEFPDLSERYGVRAVPHTVINGVVHVIGAVPEAEMLARLQEGGILA